VITPRRLREVPSVVCTQGPAFAIAAIGRVSVLDYLRPNWVYPFVNAGPHPQGVFDARILRLDTISAYPVTSMDRSVRFRTCAGERYSWCRHPPGRRICSDCAERNFDDMNWVDWYPMRILAYCRPYSFQKTGTEDPGWDLIDQNRICTCSTSWNAARDKWFCQDCAKIYGERMRERIDERIRARIPVSHPWPNPLDYPIQSHIDPVNLDQNHCRCGRTYAQIQQSYPLVGSTLNSG